MMKEFVEMYNLMDEPFFVDDLGLQTVISDLKKPHMTTSIGPSAMNLRLSSHGRIDRSGASWKNSACVTTGSPLHILRFGLVQYRVFPRIAIREIPIRIRTQMFGSNAPGSSLRLRPR